MGRLHLLVLLCLIPAVISHAIPAMQNTKPQLITRVEAMNAMKNAVRNDKVNCLVCSTIVQGINQLISEEEEEEKIDDFLKKACVTLDIEQPHVCNSIIDAFANELYFVIERVIFTPEELCGIFVDDCGTPVKVMWNLTIPGGKPAVKPWPTVKTPKKTQRILHLSDIHIDRDYAIGSEADCKNDNGKNTYALCCRNYPDEMFEASRASSVVKSPAGKWGSIYNCDLPYATFEAALKHISETHKDIDYIVITGDFEAHDIWDYTKEKTQANIQNVTQVLANYFPTTPIYESVGNHESVPMDAMAPHNMDEYETRGPSWLYNILADSWSKWISPESVKDVQYRASYIERPSPGLKIISINTIYCSAFNFYLYINQTDPDGTLTWLISELLDSESKGEKVHIISHIPAGDDYCLKGWAHNFYDIVNRFENTIAAQFYGHTHNDHFQVYYEDSDPNGRATHFNFISPFLTTYSFANPAYRIYTIDGGYEGASYTVLDAETYTTDLEVANANNQEPQWFLEYSTRDAYGMPDLSPASWAALIDKLAVDDDLFKKFHWYYFRSSYEDNCVNEPECRQKYVCYLRVAKSFEEDHFCAGAMGRQLLLVALCLIPTVLSHALPPVSNAKPLITRTAAMSVMRNAVKNDKLNCVVCSTIVQGLNQLISEDEEEEKIDDFLKKACITLDLDVPHICNAIVDQYANELYFVLERVIFTPDELCGIFVDDCGTPVNPLKVLWNLTIPGGKPPVKPWPVVKSPKKTQRVLHLSDIHVDRDYAIGSEADCKWNIDRESMELCCRNYPDTVSVAGSQADAIRTPAGKWGSVFSCDLPYRTFEAAMKHIAAAHKDIDYIVITGDFEAHDMWDYTKEKTQANILNITQVFVDNFPNIPIYESIGNHEGVPMDAMAPHNMDEYDTRGPTWLYNTLADAWSRWISPESVAGVQYRASYIERPYPGLKIISVNTVYCSAFNFYIYINQTDPDGTLTWLISELLDSESKGEKVHIISHIPAGDDYCLMGWAHNFYDIVNRFENTIAAQFYGHTHNDHFQVYYEDSDPNGRATHFNFISPSITTYSFNNPAYRIYTIDGGYEGATYTVLDAETYTTDLDEANAKNQEPQWFLEYSTKDTYGMPDLSPASWNALIDRLAVDDELFKKFHRYYFRSDHESDCVSDPVCRQKYVCYLRVAKSYEQDHFCSGFTTL